MVPEMLEISPDASASFPAAPSPCRPSQESPGSIGALVLSPSRLSGPTPAPLRRSPPRSFSPPRPPLASSSSRPPPCPTGTPVLAQSHLLPPHDPTSPSSVTGDPPRGRSPLPFSPDVTFGALIADPPSSPSALARDNADLRLLVRELQNAMAAQQVAIATHVAELQQAAAAHQAASASHAQDMADLRAAFLDLASRLPTAPPQSQDETPLTRKKGKGKASAAPPPAAPTPSSAPPGAPPPGPSDPPAPSPLPPLAARQTHLVRRSGQERVRSPGPCPPPPLPQGPGRRGPQLGLP